MLIGARFTENSPDRVVGWNSKEKNVNVWHEQLRSKLTMVLVQIRPEDGSAFLVFDGVEMRRRIDERNVVLSVEVDQLRDS